MSKRITAPAKDTIKHCKHVVAVRKDEGVYIKCRHCNKWVCIREEAPAVPTEYSNISNTLKKECENSEQ